MSHYDVTKARILQWLGIILIMAVFSGAYWYFKVYGSTLNQSQNDLNTNGLVGLWSFNGDDISGTTAYDRSGSGNNGTLTNGPTVTQGKVGQALSFDGTDDYVSVGDTAIFEPAQNITLTAWIYPTGNGSYPGIITKSASNGESLCKYSFYLYSTTRRLSFAMGGSSVQSVNLIAPLNEWSFVAVTQDGSSLKLYLNGNSETFSTLPAPSYSTETLKIGTWTGSGQSFPGRIDEVRVYNRAITASEVTSLYTQGGGTKVNTAVSQPQGTGRLDSGLAGYWKMDDGSGTSATDSSTNAYTGTLTSGPTWTTGQIGGAVSFDGVDDYIDTNNGTVLDSLSEYTYATWIYPTSANGFIIAKASNGGGSSGFRLVSSTLQGWRANFTAWTAARSTSTTTVSLNTWSHAVITYSHVGDKKQHIYLNGIEVAYSEQDTNPVGLDPDSSYDFWIGRKEGGNEMADVPFTGHIDEARIYNRALSVNEISQLYRLTTPTSVDTSLKGYWSFNASDMTSTIASDRSGAGNTGTLTNGPTITEGVLGQAASFDGTNDYVAITDTADMDYVTIAAWVKASPGTDGFVLTKDYDTVSVPFSLNIGGNSSPSNINGMAFFSSTAWKNSGITTDVRDGTWHFVAGTYDGTTLKYYVDGILDASSTEGSGVLPKNNDAVDIGRYANDADYFGGSLDEVRLYNRALTAAEIKSLYDVGQRDKINSSVSQPQGTGRLDSGLAGYWKLDDGSGTSATDSSTNGNTGTLTNGPTWTTGQVGGAVNFDGTDDYIDFGTAGMTNRTQFSVGAWINPTTLLSATTYSVISNRTAGNAGFGIYINSCSGIDPNIICDLNFTIQGVASYSATDVIRKEWQHIEAVFSGSQVKLYRNGTLVHTASTGSMTTGTNLLLGRTGNSTNYFIGSMDEVRIYDRLFSDDEVSQLYRLAVPTGVDTSLKGYWSFNGKDMSGTTAYDRSGAGNNGTLTNGPAITEGKIGQGLNFDGTDDYVTAGTATPYQFANTTFTVTGWFKKTGTLTEALVSQGGCNGGWVIFLTSGTLQPVIKGTGACGTQPASRSSSTTTLNDGTWHHFAAVMTTNTTTPASNTLSIYIDGALNQGSLSQDGTSYVTSAINLQMGARNGGPDNPLTGSLDEVRIYNRALTEAEVKSLYNSSR